MANNTLLASDNFASGSLAAAWANIDSQSKWQVISGSPNVAETNTAGTTAGQYWTGTAFTNDQISEVVATLAGGNSGTFLQLVVRNQGASVFTEYVAKVTGNGAWSFISVVNGTGTTIASGSGITHGTQDVWTFIAAGSYLGLYQNYNRIGYFYDSGITGGAPGFGGAANSSITNLKVYSWRGYSSVQQDGIWTKQGIVLPAVLGDLDGTPAGQGIQCSNVLYEGNAQLLSGTVFKAWPWNPITGNTYYAESTDGYNWTRQVSAIVSSYVNFVVFKNGSTYYGYAQASGSSGTGNVAVFTSSDGVNWSQQSPSNVIGLGASGWDSASIYPQYPYANIGGTWYGLYVAQGSGDLEGFSTGLCTSTDLINWTKYASNPVTSNTLRTGGIYAASGKWFMWFTANQPGQGNISENLLDPEEVVRYQTTDFIHFTNPVHSFHHSQTFESLNTPTGFVYPAGAPIVVGGKTYQFLNSGSGDSTGADVSQIELATAPAPVSSIVQFNEDAVQQIATDPFTSGAGNLDGDWTTPTGGTALKIVAGPYVEPTTTSTVCQAVYTGAAFNQNQYSEITIEALTGTLFQSYVMPMVLASTTALTDYEAEIGSPTGTSDAAAKIFKRVAGTATQIGPTITCEPTVGDVFRLSVIFGSDGFPVLTLFQNGFQLLQIQDTSSTPITSGNPGMAAYSSVAIADAQISLFAAGNANVIPAYVINGGNGNLGLLRLLGVN